MDVQSVDGISSSPRVPSWILVDGKRLQGQVALYLFAGAKRKRDIAAFVNILADADGSEAVRIVQFDVARCASHDLSEEELQAEIKQAVEDGFVHVIILSPPAVVGRVLYSTRA